MAHEVETMMYNRERGLPWHGLGTPVQGKQTAKKAIIAAGLDWEVELRDAMTTDGKGKPMRMPGIFAVVRVSDDTVFGPVRSRYVPFQNREAFDFADNLVDSDEAKYDTAGALRGGRQVFLSMEMPEHILVGGEDAHQMYILLRTSHDGTKAISVYVVMIRVVCMNTLTWAINGAKHMWSVPHTSTMEGKLQEARDTLGLSFAYRDAFNVEAEKLMAKKLTDGAAVKALQTVLPNRPKTEERIDDIMNCLKTSTTNGYAGTGWGLMNALTEYQQHWRDTEPEATFHNVIDGELRKWRGELGQLLLAR